MRNCSMIPQSPVLWWLSWMKMTILHSLCSHTIMLVKSLISLRKYSLLDKYFLFSQTKLLLSGVNAMANVDELVVQVTARDPDLGANGSIIYYIATSNLFKLVSGSYTKIYIYVFWNMCWLNLCFCSDFNSRYGSNKSSGSIVPSPFNITQTGQLRTVNYMAEYNQDRFIVDVVAREQAAPERETRTKVHVSTHLQFSVSMK